MPFCLFVAGPNGCGKSTLTSTFSNSPVVLDPDKFALEHGGLIAGGKVLISRFNELISQSTSVVLETTLSGATALNRMRSAKKAGFKIEFHYVSVARIDIAVSRVKERVASGGHDVPLKDQER